jgi:hypothetical protein
VRLISVSGSVMFLRDFGLNFTVVLLLVVHLVSQIGVSHPMSSPDGEVHLSYPRGKASKRGGNV